MHPIIKNNPITIINLERRDDKREYVKGEMKRMGIDHYEIFKAHETKPGKNGCTKSHLDLMAQSKLRSDIFTIIEDDVTFLQPWSVINKAIEELPDDWDALYLGASPQQPQQRHSDHLFRLINGKVTHAVIWNNRHGVIDEILKLYPSYAPMSNDRFLAEIIQPIHRIFVSFPLSSTQRQFNSDTCQRADLSSIERNFNKYCL